MKRCCTCHELKPLSAFNVRRAARDGRQDRCRECFQAWYVVNRESHMANVHERNVRVRAELRARLLAYLREHPCVDCGNSDVRVLELDHRDRSTKRHGVGRLFVLTESWTQIKAEIAKCDVRCVNCHRRRTTKQLGWWRGSIGADD